jgi:hypothetical protein
MWAFDDYEGHDYILLEYSVLYTKLHTLQKKKDSFEGGMKQAKVWTIRL